MGQLWTKTNDNTVTVSVTENTTTSSRTAVITVSAGNLVQTVSVEQTENGVVVINGVRWATCNVDRPGSFATHPEDAGMFYQWNRNVGWSSTDPMKNSNGSTTWDNSYSDGNSWEKINDPSPIGYRVPTYEEIRSLFDTVKVINEWTKVNGINGKKITDRNTGFSIFLPAVGTRDGFKNGSLGTIGTYGLYWSSTSDSFSAAHGVYFESSYIDANSGYFRANASPIRCVKN